MRLHFPIPTTLLCVFTIAAFAGCGGDDDPGSGTVSDPDPTTTVTVEQFVSGFADQTGVELSSEDFPGDAVLLGFDDDGEAFEFSEAETEFIDEYGTAQIFVVETGGDPEMILDAVTGQGLDESPVELGGDTVRLVTKVADKPDADGVIWVRQCVRYETDKSRNTCSWKGNKIYGRNVITSWISAEDSLDDQARKLDQAVSETVAGA